MKCVSYNIHFGVGADGRYDLARILDPVADADVILLQEATRYCPWNGQVDMPAEIAAALPDRFCHFHAATDVVFGSAVEAGRAVTRRFQFGNMIVSRTEPLTLRAHLLPRQPRRDRLNLQRGALEALLATPAGLTRFIVTHLDHVDPAERMAQVEALRHIALHDDGGALSGTGEIGFPDVPGATGTVLAGDFNFEPEDREHAALRGAGELVDVSAADPGWTCHDPARAVPHHRIDHVFATAGLAGRVTGVRIDHLASGSDHVPVHFTVG